MEQSEHFNKLVSACALFRKNDFLCDTLLLVGEKQFKAHSVVLAAASSFFKSVYEQYERPEMYYIKLPGVDPELMPIILDYMYTGKIILPYKNEECKLPPSLFESFMTFGLDLSNHTEFVFDNQRDEVSEEGVQTANEMKAEVVMQEEGREADGSEVIIKEEEDEDNDEESNKKLWMCEDCNRTFHRKTAYDKHMLMHAEEDKPTLCELCGMAVNGKAEMQNHLAVVHAKNIKNEWFNCNLCEKTFSKELTLQHHVNKVHKTGSSETKEGGRREFTCEYCDKQYASRTSIKLHTVMVHLKVKPYQCAECGRGFAFKSQMISHTRMHTGVTLTNKYILMDSKIFEGARKGQIDVLEESVRAGASVNQVDLSVHKFTPLHISCQHGNLQCVEWLLRHGADHSVRSSRGWTALHLSSIRGFRKIAQELLRQRADVMAKDLKGCSPGHLAVIHNHPTLLYTFLSSGIEVDCKDDRGWSMVHHCCYHGNVSCLRLLDRASLHQADFEGNTPLHLACMAGELSCVKQLLSYSNGNCNIWINSKNFQGKTPNTEAIEAGRGVVVGYLQTLERQSAPLTSTQQASFPAHLAARTGDLMHLMRLVEEGVVDLNEKDDEGNTLLHKAIGQGSVVKWLLENGAEVNTCNNHGESCLEMAGRLRDLESSHLMQSYLHVATD